MSKAVQCPSCGAEHVVHNPGITALQCEFCKTLIYWDEQAIKAAGTKAILDPPSSNLRVGEAVQLKGQDMVVLGRVRYSYGGGAGLWDEWFLEDTGQNIIWLTEDEKEFVIEKPIADDPSFPQFSQLGLGQTLQVHNRPFLVEELGKAACLGVEGQVPFVVIPEEVYPFADLASSDGTLSVGVEFDRDGSPSLYQGEFVPRDALKVDGQPPFPDVVSPGKGVRCSGCGAPVDGHFPPDTKMLVCQSCGSGLELNATQTRVVTKNRQKAPKFVLEIGDVGLFDKNKYEVVGRLHYVERDEGRDYPSDEYLLFNDKQGYLWLEESDGHWMRTQRSHKQPPIDLFGFIAPRSKVKIGDTSYQYVEKGRTQLRYVDGALPWSAVVGEYFEYADLVAPPKSFSAELSKGQGSQELEFFAGTYVPIEAMRKAFKDKKFPLALGVGMAQPFIRTAGQKAVMLIGLVFGLINFGLLMTTCGGGQRIFNTSLTAEQYRGEWLSEPFNITDKPAILHISGNANVNQSWLALQIGLVNAQDEVCLQTEEDVSYYHGYEGGEHWSEGSRTFSKLVRVDEPGAYRLLVMGAAASGNNANDDPRVTPTLNLSVQQGLRLSRYYILMMLLAFFYPIKEYLRRHSHEKRRFPADDDDD